MKTCQILYPLRLTAIIQPNEASHHSLIMSSRQKYALITGCGQGGIGEALVREYTRQGLRVIATVLPCEPSTHLSGTDISCFPLDVTKERSIVDLQKHVNNLTGGYLDVLVNNAGICYTMTAIDTDVAEVQKMFDVNLFGPMRMVHHFHKEVIAAHGAIVNIGSVGGIVPYLYGSAYNSSKAALHHWSNTLRVEMKPFSVRVVTVISGEVGTNILARDQMAGRELPEESFYSPLAAEFKQHIHRVPETTNRFLYAEKVVAESLKSSPSAWFWYGNTTAFVRFFDVVGFRTVWDYVFWIWFGLAKLRKAHYQRSAVDFARSE
ncbi:NAD(P)-binding protein [Xylaria sp. FL1042]|nr:NAD(P)-binding protein [Xylaria sp. FL1042]